jgi:hypothetical protein
MVIFKMLVVGNNFQTYENHCDNFWNVWTCGCHFNYFHKLKKSLHVHNVNKAKPYYLYDIINNSWNVKCKVIKKMNICNGTNIMSCDILEMIVWCIKGTFTLWCTTNCNYCLH